MTDTVNHDSRHSTSTLFIEYLNVCNAALARHGDNFPLREILTVAQREMGNERICVAVYADDPATPLVYFTVKLNETRRLELVDHGTRDPGLEWKAPRRYLEEVVNHPRHYIDNPMKLDWDWLEARIDEVLPVALN